MEQSEQPVQSDTQAGVGESSLTAVPPLSPDFTTVDNNLTGIGFFTASSKRSRRAVEKTSTIIDHGVERRISILPSAKYGLPITQDQDCWLALMKLVREHIQKEGKLTNPFGFTTAAILKTLGHQTHNGKNYKAVEEWISVMTFTGIEGGVYNAARKTWFKDRTHAVERIVTLGKELPDGTIADKNYIWFSTWQLDNINAGHLMAIELTTYTQLQNNIAKNLVPHLQEWLFASQRDGRFEKQYEDICQLLGIRVYRYRSQIAEQLAPSLDELVFHNYISKWAIEPMANQKNYKLVLWHGSKYHKDRQTRIDRKQRVPISPSAGESTSPVHRPRQRRLNLRPAPPEPQPTTPSPVIDYRLVAELTKRGISETDARTILATLTAGQAVLDQLEWGDFQVNQSRGKLTNPPGFYISLLQRNIIPPPTFETSATRNARERADLERQQGLQLEAEAQRAADAAAEAELDHLKTVEPERYQALYARAQEQLIAAHPKIGDFLRSHPGSALHDGAIRARIKNLLAAQSASLIPTTPIDNLHQATNPPTRQTIPLQAGSPETTFAATLQTILRTPQLGSAKALSMPDKPTKS